MLDAQGEVLYLLFASVDMTARLRAAPELCPTLVLLAQRLGSMVVILTTALLAREAPRLRELPVADISQKPLP